MQVGLMKVATRWSTLAVLVGGLAGGLQANVAWGQANQKVEGAKTIASPDVRSLTAKDGQKIKITYYKSTLGKDAAVIVFLHMKDGNRFIWQGDRGLATRLQGDGYAVITVDLRGHGESKDDAATTGNANQDDKKKKKPAAGKKPDLKPAEVALMVNADMEAVKGFIYDEHQAENLNMNKLVLVGPELGASIAVEYALIDWYKKPHSDGQPGFQTPRGQDVHGLVLISPQSTYQGIVMPKVLPELKDPAKNIAFLICTGTGPDKAQGKKLFEQITVPKDNEKRMYLSEFPSKLQGTDLLGKGLKIEDTIVGFCNKHIKTLDIPWRDRRSKLER